MRVFGSMLRVSGGVILVVGGAAGLFVSWLSAVLNGDPSYLTTQERLQQIVLVYMLPWLTPISFGSLLFFAGGWLRRDKVSKAPPSNPDQIDG